MTTSLINQKDFQSSVLEITNLFSNLDDKQNIFFQSNEISYLTDNFFNIVCNTYGKNTSTLKLISNFIKQYCLKTEQIAGDSSKLLISFSSNLLKESIKLINSGISTPELESRFQTFLLKFENELSKCIQITTLKDIEDIIKNTIKDNKLSSILIEAIKLGGLESKIICEKNQSTQSSIELKNGFNFNIEHCENFFDKTGVWVRENVKTLVVDGSIDNIAEIDHILTKCNINKEPMVIFAYGFSQEVINTLKLNFERKTLDILPIRIPMELETLNSINDIACVCNTDLISSLKGELITFVKYDSIPIVENIFCKGKVLTINNNASNNRVKSQINNILQQINKTDSEYILKSLNNRLRSLTSNRVIIKIGVLNDENTRNNEKIDLALRVVQSTIKSGIVNKIKLNEIIEEIDDVLIKKALKMTEFPELLSAFALGSSIKLSFDMVKNILSTSGAIVKD